MDLSASTGRSHSAPKSQEVVRVDFYDTNMLLYEQPLNMIPTSKERNSISVAEPMKLSVGRFLLIIPNSDSRPFYPYYYEKRNIVFDRNLYRRRKKDIIHNMLIDDIESKRFDSIV